MKKNLPLLFVFVCLLGCNKPTIFQPTITTDEQAISNAYRFLAVARIKTNDFLMAKPATISIDRLKGVKNWRVGWSPADTNKETFALKWGYSNDLAILVFEDGRFYYSELTNMNTGYSIEGDLSNLTTRGFEIQKTHPNKGMNGTR